MFTSKDLPLAITTPVTSGEHSADSPVCAVNSVPKIQYPLVACATTLMLVVRTVLVSALDAGDTFARLAAHSHQALNLILLVRAAPLPALSPVTLHHYARLYDAALNTPRTPFHADNPFPPLHDYIESVVERTAASNSVLLTACIYLDRLVVAEPQLFLRSANVHKMFAVAFMLAFKFLEDDYLTSHFFSPALRIPKEELNQLEIYFLRCINYHLFVDPESFCDAQITLMANAIHSENGIPVLHTLRHRGISGLAHAYSRMKPWLVCPKNAYSRHYTDSNLVSPDVLGPEDIATTFLPGSIVETEETRSILAQIAAVQLQHDYPNLQPQPYAGALQSRYNHNGIVRYALLHMLSEMELVDDVTLPPLEYQWQSSQQRWKVPTVVAHNCAQPAVRVHAGEGFGSFLVNAPHVAAIYGSQGDSASAPSGCGMWHYQPTAEMVSGEDVRRHETEERGGIGPVVAGGLGVMPSIWSVPRGYG